MAKSRVTRNSAIHQPCGDPGSRRQHVAQIIVELVNRRPHRGQTGTLARCRAQPRLHRRQLAHPDFQVVAPRDLMGIAGVILGIGPKRHQTGSNRMHRQGHQPAKREKHHRRRDQRDHQQ
jgi:hypothetical protein